MIDHNILHYILSYFQKNEYSYIVGLVCKKWNSIIEQNKKLLLKQIVQQYTRDGRLNVIKWFGYVFCIIYY